MTDKQIIIDGVDVSGCCQYRHRYMEDYDIDTLDYCMHHFKPCKDVDVKYCYYKQLKAKEQECEELKVKNIKYMNGNISYQLKNSLYRQTLIEIKPILELYANSKAGEEQLDGTYKITVKNSSVLGDTYITFDPRPAKQALQKISEVENE